MSAVVSEDLAVKEAALVNTSTLEPLKEDELDPHFIEQVAASPGGSRLRRCIQCGTCSGSCQMSQNMDYTPRRLVAMIRAGMKKEVLKSQAIWYCASCYSCTARCPMGIKLTEVFFNLKGMSLREGYAGSRKTSPAFYRSFYNTVEYFGRMHEVSLVLMLVLRTNPLDYIGLAPFGINMFLKGKLPILPDRVKKMKEIKTLVEQVRRMEVS